jgi:3-phenylpropionate/trans-cinnamate dioxygenase ferredoxin subunit
MSDDMLPAPVSGRRCRVADLADLTDGEATAVDAEGRRIALVRFGDDVYAVDDTCSHQNFSLSEGEVDPDECTIECWKHGALFSLTTGEPLTLPALRPVAVYPVSIDEGEVSVVLPDAVDEGAHR